MAAQMQCPLHQRAAIVDVEWNESEALQIEVFTCCDESRQQVLEAPRHRPATTSVTGNKITSSRLTSTRKG
jgi:hypothetical protein